MLFGSLKSSPAQKYGPSIIIRHRRHALISDPRTQSAGHFLRGAGFAKEGSSDLDSEAVEDLQSPIENGFAALVDFHIGVQRRGPRSHAHEADKQADKIELFPWKAKESPTLSVDGLWVAAMQRSQGALRSAGLLGK
jgi:hypothetical protein